MYGEILVYLHCDPSFVVSLEELDSQCCQFQQPLVTSRESTHHNIITELHTEIEGKERRVILIIIIAGVDIVHVHESVYVREREEAREGGMERERKRGGEKEREGDGERGHLPSTECVLHLPVRT